MKKNIKKLLSALLVLTMVFSMTTFTQAQKSNEPIVETFYPRTSKYYSSFLGTYYPANRPIITARPADMPFTARKSSNNSVATLFTRNGRGNSEGATGLFLNIKKPGKVTVSYKCDGKSEKATYIFKRYTSPFSSIRVGGYNLTSRFKNRSTYIMNYSRFKGKTFKINYKLKKDWNVDVNYLEKPGNMKTTMVKNGGSFKITDKNCALLMEAYNTKTRQYESCNIIFR